MDILIFFGIVALIVVVPVMIAAKMAGANRSGFGYCLIAVLAGIAAENLGSSIFGSPLIETLVILGATGLCFAAILGASFLKGLLIAVVAYGVQIGVILVLGALGLSLAGVEVTT